MVVLVRKAEGASVIGWIRGMIVLLLSFGALAAHAQEAPDPVAAVVARVKASVVQIITVRSPVPPDASVSGPAKTASDDRPITGIGSGFLVDPSGYIATNKHVVDGAVSVFVATSDGVRYRARIVGLTYHADFALLKIDVDHATPAAVLGDSDKLRIGDRVIAIGSPFGFDNSVTTGVVSGLNRDIMESPFDDYIQTDAAINHGNSGGPLFNMEGEVVGMNSILFAPGTVGGSIGLGFAIPANDIGFVVGRMRGSGGHVNAGMLPIRTQPVTWMLARAIGVPDLHGAMVAGLDVAGLDVAGLDVGGDKMMDGQIKPGDVIVAFNGRPVTDPRDLARKAGVSPIGSDAALEIFRGNARQVVHVKILGYPEEAPPDLERSKPHAVGLDLAAASGQGVMVSGIDPMGTAADSGIQKGDVILQVQQYPVGDPTEASRLIQAQSALKRGYAALLVQRDGKPTWIPIAVPD
jgi:serine protease Do